MHEQAYRLEGVRLRPAAPGHTLAGLQHRQHRTPRAAGHRSLLTAASATAATADGGGRRDEPPHGGGDVPGERLKQPWVKVWRDQPREREGQRSGQPRAKEEPREDPEEAGGGLLYGECCICGPR